MPFDARIAKISVEREQFVTAGQTMLVAEDLARVEISARVRIEQLEALVADQLKLASAIDLSAKDADELLNDLGLSASVRLDIGRRFITWPAEVRRLTFALDPRTRTIGLVVAVDNPVGQIVPGERPPLVKDMFVEVRVRGQERRAALLLPREALRRDGDAWTAYVADDSNRLRRRSIEVDSAFGNVAVIGRGVQSGDRVVVSALSMPVDGMLLEPREDAELKRRLRLTDADEAP